MIESTLPREPLADDAERPTENRDEALDEIAWNEHEQSLAWSAVD